VRPREERGVDRDVADDVRLAAVDAEAGVEDLRAERVVLDVADDAADEADVRRLEDTSSFTFSTAWMRVALSFWLIAASMRFSAAFVTVFLTSSGISTPLHAIFSILPSFLRSSSCIETISPMPFWAILRPSTMSSSETSRAPPSTIMIESAEPATTMSMSENSSAWNVGLRSHFPSTRPTRTPAIGPVHGIRLALSANDVAMRPSTSWSFSWSAERT
jgi:hypothetical protein